MAFIGLDGFYAPLCAPVKAADAAVVISPGWAAALRAVPSGSYTYFILTDGIAREIIKYMGGASIISDGAGNAVVPVTRGVDGDAQNIARNGVVKYGFCTQIVEDLIAASKAA